MLQIPCMVQLLCRVRVRAEMGDPENRIKIHNGKKIIITQKVGLSESLKKAWRGRGLKIEQAQLGVPHSRIQVEPGFILQAGTCKILHFAQNPRQSQSVQGIELNWGGDTKQKKWVGGWSSDFSTASWLHQLKLA